MSYALNSLYVNKSCVQFLFHWSIELELLPFLSCYVSLHSTFQETGLSMILKLIASNGIKSLPLIQALAQDSVSLLGYKLHLK